MIMSEPRKRYEHNRSKIHPLMFMLWISIASLCMMFAAMTSFILVREASGNWLEFTLPQVFYINTGVIILSSIVLHLSYWGFKKGNVFLYRSMLPLALILGCMFVVLQYKGWMDMNGMGIYLDGNASGAITMVVSGLHAAHVLGGIGALILATLHAFMLPYKVTETRKQRFARTVTYWHFVDILWIYLLIVFINVL